MSDEAEGREPRIPERCWTDHRLVARPSPIEGLGLFATAPIAKGEIVATLGGRAIDDAELDEIARSRPHYNSAAIGEGTNLLLSDDELIARGNHSCDSNLWMRGALTLEARSDIAPGDELTVDYALATAVDWEMRCNCRSPLCRTVVRGSDWRRPELQERYRDHFSPFLNERIRRYAGAQTRSGSAPAGVLAIDKPAGWTSFDVVAVARKTLGIRRLGHGGTLDPAATGLLPILVGEGTKFTERLHTAPKVYAALVRFGSETDTDDREGKPTRASPPPSRADAESALGGFRGVITQTPPDYAAVKVGGRPAYARARAGETLTLAAREVQVHRLDVTRWSTDTDLGLLVVCSSGTYVRSLARDLGRATGSAAHLADLRRLAVGALEVWGATPIDVLRREGRDAAVARLRPLGDETLVLPARYLTVDADQLVGEEALS